MQAKIAARTPEEADAFERMAVEDEQGRRRSEIAEKRTGWNAPKRHASFKPSQEGPWGVELGKLKSMLEPSPGRILALTGGRGNGKTQLAVELMKARTASLKSALFSSAVEFFIKIKSTYRKDSDTDEMEVLREFQKPSLLVIDEIGKRGGSEWENTMLFELLNRRYNDMTDTILIDNRTKTEFSDTIGPSLASRMNEGGGIVSCEWPSFRT
jgi:DNA replication protein DnaC